MRIILYFCYFLYYFNLILIYFISYLLLFFYRKNYIIAILSLLNILSILSIYSFILFEFYNTLFCLRDFYFFNYYKFNKKRSFSFFNGSILFFIYNCCILFRV